VVVHLRSTDTNEKFYLQQKVNTAPIIQSLRQEIAWTSVQSKTNGILQSQKSCSDRKKQHSDDEAPSECCRTPQESGHHWDEDFDVSR